MSGTKSTATEIQDFPCGSEYCREKSCSDAHITNVSRRSVVIDKNGLLFRVIYKKLGKKLADGGTSDGSALSLNLESSDPSSDKSFIALAPGRSYETVHRLTLTDDFFEGQTSYRLLLIYGQSSSAPFRGLEIWSGTVSSNEMPFEIK